MTHAQHVLENKTVYRATDAAQMIYRRLLSVYSEDELNRLERAIGTFTATGIVPASLGIILDAATDLPAAA